MDIEEAIRIAGLDENKLVASHAKVEAVTKELGGRTESPLVEGIGQHLCRVPTAVYFDEIRRSGDPGFWRDQRKVQKWLQENPEYRVTAIRKSMILTS